MAEKIDREAEAVEEVVNAVEPLSPELRLRVLDCVVKRLHIDLAIPALAAMAASEPKARDGSPTENASSPHLESLMRRYGIMRFNF